MYCHAHLVTNATAKQYIISSGSLFLSPPQPAENVARLRHAVSEKLQTLDPNLSLASASASQLVEAIGLAGIQSWFLQWEERLDGWQKANGNIQRVLLSDVQKEVRSQFTRKPFTLRIL